VATWKDQTRLRIRKSGCIVELHNKTKQSKGTNLFVYCVLDFTVIRNTSPVLYLLCAFALCLLIYVQSQSNFTEIYVSILAIANAISFIYERHYQP